MTHGVAICAGGYPSPGQRLGCLALDPEARWREARGEKLLRHNFVKKTID